MLVPLPEIIRYVLPKFLQYLILWITFAGFFFASSDFLCRVLGPDGAVHYREQTY